MVLLVPLAASIQLRETVLNVAIELGDGLNQDLYVVHLVETDTAASADRDVRDDIRAQLSDTAVSATVALEHVGHWSPRPAARVGRDVLELARDVQVTHIVMGHTSKGVLAELAHGSTVEAVIDEAPVPVTVVSEHVARDRER
ncbi:MAG: universal stress protein [Halorhabdus sp.]